MKVLVVSPYIPPRIGGIERHTYELVKSLTGHGVDVEVVTSSPPRGESIDIPQFMTVRMIPSITVLGRLPIPLINYRSIKELKKLKKSRFDLIILQSHLFPLVAICGFFFRGKAKILWVNHGSGFVPSHVKSIAMLLRTYEKLMLRSVTKSATKLVSVSKSGADWIMEQTNKVSHVVPNGVPSDALDFPLNKQSTEVRVLFVGRLLPGKGGMEAIKIFESALKLIPPNICREKFVLEIIGIGPELDKLREASTGLNLRIVFHGAKSHMETLSTMSESHIFIFPSTYPEGLPTVILEAFANQMAVIVSSNMPGLRNAIDSDVLVECESTDFAEKLLDLLISPQSIERYGLKAREYVTANHDWSHISSKLIEGIEN